MRICHAVFVFVGLCTAVWKRGTLWHLLLFRSDKCLYRSGTGRRAFRVVLCASALSAMGASVFLQVRAFAGKEISLKALLLSRLLHLPLMLFLVKWLLSVLPMAQSVAAWNEVYASRLPVDAACILFVLCALMVNGGTGGLRNRKKRV